MDDVFGAAERFLQANATLTSYGRITGRMS
jgi:hypothetical protein